MVNKKIYVTLLVLIMTVCIMSSALALTANIGNARMILRVNVGDTVSKTVLVRNVNNASVNISAFASGDLANYTVIKNPTFTLASNEEKNIEFTIKVTKNGTTTTKINVGFAPTEGKGGGVGLSSEVIIIAGGNSMTGDTGEGTGMNVSMGVWIAVGATVIIVLVFLIVIIVYLKKGSKERDKEVKLNRPKKA